MAADKMPTQSAFRRERFFQVHRCSRRKPAHCRARDRFRGYVRPETVAGKLDGRQAYAVDGDTVAQSHIREIELPRADAKAQVAISRLDRLDAPNRLDDPRKQASTLRRSHCHPQIIADTPNMAPAQGNPIAHHRQSGKMRHTERHVTHEMGREVNDHLVHESR